MSVLAGRTAVVTGAGSGIGRAVALALAAREANPWLVGRSLEKLEAVAALVAEAGGVARCCVADFTREADVRTLAGQLRAGSGVDVLVHSAGAIVIGPVESVSADELDLQYRVNLRAPYVLTQALLPMLKAGAGQIVFVNSIAGLSPGPNHAAYAATKAGLKALADSLRAEVNPEGVRILSVYPGRTATPMQQAVQAAEGKVYRPELLAQPGDVAGLVVEALSLPRTAEVTDLVVRPMKKP